MAITARNEQIEFGQLEGLRVSSAVLMSRVTGKRIPDEEHLRQSIVDILTTPLGSRVMLRNYGSRLFQLIDRPINESLLLELYSATIEALGKWEPRILVTNVQFDLSGWNDGRLVMALEGHYLLTSGPLRIRDISVDFMQSNRFEIVDPDADEIIRESATLGDIALASPTTITVGFASGFGTAGDAQTDVRDLLRAWELNALFTGGGMNLPNGSGAAIAANQAAFNEWFTAKNWYPALGHEDWLTAGAAPHIAKFAYLPSHRRYYSTYFPYVSAEFFVIDTDASEPDGVTGGSLQAAWLRNALLNSKAKYRIVVGNKAAVSRSADAVAQNRALGYLSWLHSLPKAHLYLHGGSGTSQHNMVVENDAPKMHIVDSGIGGVQMAAQLQGAVTGVQPVWAAADTGEVSPPTITKLVFTKQYATVTVHHASSGETLHTFHLHPF